MRPTRVSSKPRRKLPPQILTRSQIAAVLRACGRGRTGARTRALIVLAWRSGLRCAEALDLQVSDVDLEKGVVVVRKGKGGKRRVVGLDPLGCEVVRRWVSIRTLTLGARPTAPLLCTLKGRPVLDKDVRKTLGRLAKRARVGTRVHLHGLRHTFAVELSRENVPLHVIQAALGHAHASTTSRYLDHAEPREVLSATRQRRETHSTLAVEGSRTEEEDHETD